jgi:hypothetical protein
MTWKSSDHVRCGCKGPDGKQLGRSCPQLWRKDGSWNTRHGTAGFMGRIDTSAGTKQLKRFGYPSRKAAETAAEHVGKLLDLAVSQTDRERICDMLWAVKRGVPLPTVEDVQRRLGLGLDPSQPGLSVGEWLDTWLATKRRTKRESICRGLRDAHPFLAEATARPLATGSVERRSHRGTVRHDRADQHGADRPAHRRGRPDGREGRGRRARPVARVRADYAAAHLRHAAGVAQRGREAAEDHLESLHGVELEQPETAERQRWTPAEASQLS